jgi:hypothetical protein
MKYELTYKTFDKLLEEVRIDFEGYDIEKHIKPQQLIKVAMRVNYDLGIRINQTREVIRDIENLKVRLPDDFLLLNYALICGSYKVTQPVIQGTTIEDVIIAPLADCNNETTSCQPEQTCMTQCGDYFQLIQKIKTETRTYDQLYSIRFQPSRYVPLTCPNTKWGCANEAFIKHGYIFTNIDCGQIYLNYQGQLTDEDDNLLVVDHPMINEYYEYALKQRILENMYFDGEDVIQKMGLIEPRVKAARNNALSIVNMPGFKEMYEIWDLNRKAQYHKYYNQFRSI